jgi:hypothetical protein
MGSACRESVVLTRRRGFGRATSPSARISRATRFRLVASPSARSSRSIRGALYVPLLAVNVTRTCAINTSSMTALQDSGRRRYAEKPTTRPAGPATRVKRDFSP